MRLFYPYSMRFALVFDYIDTAAESYEISRMDGPAFHKASDILKDLKGSKLIINMSTGEEIIDKLVAGEINLIFLLKKRWSPRQRGILNEYKKIGKQNMIAKSLGITQQAVSKTIKRSLWREISIIEEDLNYALQHKHREQLKKDEE